MRYFLAFVGWFLVFSMGFAQENYMDVLNKQLQKTDDDHQKNEVFLKMADWLYSDGNRKRSLGFLQEVIKQSKKSDTQQSQLLGAYTQMTRLYLREDDYAKAKAYVDSAKALANQQKNIEFMARTELAEGRLFEYMENREKAHAKYTKALSRIEDREDLPLLRSTLYYQLYALFIEWNELDQAKSHIQHVIENAESISPKNMLANAYSGKAMVYSYYLDESKSRQDRDSMMYYAHKSIQLYRDFPGEVTANTQASNLLNQANYYWRYFDRKNQRNLRTIKENINEAFEVMADKADNEVNQANAYGMLSSISIAEKDYDKAEDYLHRAYTVMMTRKKAYYPTLINVVRGLSSLYEIKEDHENALKFEREALRYSRKLFNEEASNTVKRLEAQYEFEKKETEIVFLKEKSERQRKQNLLYIGLIIIGVVGTFFMFRSYHFNLKYSHAREEQLKAEQKKSETDLKLKQEEQNRLETERKLLALEQQQLQDEIMARELQLQYKNEVLQELKDKLRSDNTLSIQQLLKQETRSDHNFEEVKFQIQKIHPNFFNKISDSAHKKLTALDLKYCAYFHLGMETKQVAQIMGVAPKSIRVTKYRIKKKFGLPKEVDLIDFLKEII